jgi:hypothetical protein
LKGVYEMKTKFFNAISLAVIMSMLVTSLALADNVQNDVVAGGNDTFTLGGSTTVNYRITANNGDGQTGCNASDGSPAIVTINTPAGVTATPGSLSFSSCGTSLSTTFTASAAGNYAITVSVSDSGSGTYNANPASFNLHVLTPPPPTDITPPFITPHVSGTLGNNGWYTSDVTVSWTVVDDESAVSSSSGCDLTIVDTDTTAINLTCSATSAGGTNSQSVTIKRDSTTPSVSLIGGPANGGSYYFGSVPAAPTCSASDATSGLDGACSVFGYGSTVGSHTVSASAFDYAGNEGTASVSFDVLAWTLNGFYQPVDMNGVWNTVKGGSTVPFKFEVFAGSTELTDTAFVKSFVATPVACPASSAVADAIEFTTTGGTTLRYDWTAGQFINNWQTPKKPGFCYVVTMTTEDGSSLSANFKLK